MTTTSRLLALCLLLFATAGDASPRVVVLGFDGADAALTAQLMADGKLPHLAALRASGAFSPLATTNPPQTPVSWSSFATGLNPGRTTIFDFLKRAPRTYIPTFALNEESKRTFLAGERNPLVGALCGFVAGLLLFGVLTAVPKRTRRMAPLAGLVAGLALCYPAYRAFARYLPTEVPDAINNRQGDTLWGLAARAGLRTQIIRVPATFPASEKDGGRFLSGLGVPDIRGTVGTFSYYTTERLKKEEDTEFGGKIVELQPFTDQATTVVFGPRNKLFYKPDPKTHIDPEGDAKDIDLPMVLRRTGDALAIEVSGKRLTLGAGEWSDWVELTFPFNPLIKLRGIARFHLIALEPELKLYLSPINIHPHSPPVSFSYPADFAWQLKEKHGFYKTIGWAEDTWSYTEGRLDEEAFLHDVDVTVKKEEEFMTDLLAAGDFDLFVQVFSFTDRVAHVFWRLGEPDHPAYDAALAARYAETIERWYVRMDTIVGKARELVADHPDTLLLVVSDHGFATWHRSVNYNTWLVKNGFMALHQNLGGRKLTLEDLFGNQKFWPYVDWSKTRAYSLGLGNIYVNLKGREPQGIVEPGPSYEALLGELKQGLENLVDPGRETRPVARVYRREEMYHGYDPELIPDLRVANNPGYRVSWQSSLGATPAEVFEDNTKPWSADHCSLDPDAVPGILFSSQVIRAERPAIIDVMPSILSHLGLAVPDGLDGKSFL